MEIGSKISGLYEKDTKEAYANLGELEALSREGDTLYPYLEECLIMLRSPQYVVRVRGFRLLCMQAKWDVEGKINGAIDEILAALNDQKPTAVRQALQYLEFVVPYKKELTGKIMAAVLAIDCSKFKDTMRPLIEKDIRHLVQLTQAQSL